MLDAFETLYSVRLPADLRRYFSAVNGMLAQAGSDWDVNGFHFWPLEDLRPVNIACGTDVPVPEGQVLEKHFVFVDYFQWSWAYAIDLSGAVEGSHPIIHVGTLQPKTVAHSFTEFLDLYLRDAVDLYPAKGD